MLVNILICYLYSSILVIAVLNAMINSMQYRGVMEALIHKSTNNKKRSPHAFDGHFFTVIVGKWRESNCSHLFSYDCVQTISLLEKKLKMNSTELTCDNFKPPEASSVIKTRTFFEQKNFFFWNNIF